VKSTALQARNFDFEFEISLAQHLTCYYFTGIIEIVMNLLYSVVDRCFYGDSSSGRSLL
jgi:hypothetical protein